VNVEVISEDHALFSLCREIASEFPQTTWNLSIKSGFDDAHPANIYLFDYKPGMDVPEAVRWGTRAFILVDCRQLETFRSTYPAAEPGIVLKPVTRAVFRGLLAQSTGFLDGAGSEALRTDRDDILQCLMHANLRLQQYDSERTNFLGRALHDFHAPLTALSGYCGLLLEEKTGLLNERQKLIIDRMHHSVRRLSRMSRAMFQLSVGRQIALKPALREGDIRECAEQALYEVQQLVQEKDLQLDIDFEPLFVPLLIDTGQMEQVMINLLENACKFSPRGGVISIKGYACFTERRAKNVLCPSQTDRRTRDMCAPNAYRVDIQDAGPGISPENLKDIFEEYVSYSGGQDRSRGGLGLAICRMILTQHQGRIWAENGRPGAIFSFVLPLPRAAASSTGSGQLCLDDRSESFAACV
jgi:signal transduction histidine kinase